MVAKNKPPVLKDQLGLRPVLPPREPKKGPDIPPLLQELENYFAQKPGAKIINQQGYFDPKAAALFKAELSEWQNKLTTFSQSPQSPSSRRLIEAYLGKIHQGNGMIAAAEVNFSNKEAPKPVASAVPSSLADNIAGNREGPKDIKAASPDAETLKARLQAEKGKFAAESRGPFIHKSPISPPINPAPISAPPPVLNAQILKPIQPRTIKEVTPAETALQSISDYFAKAPGKKVFEFESGKHHPEGAKLYKVELEAQQKQLDAIKAQYANEIKDSPYLKNIIGGLQAQIQQGNTVIQLKQDGISREAQQTRIVANDTPQEKNPFKRFMNKFKETTAEPKPLSEAEFRTRFDSELDAYRAHYQDSNLALEAFQKVGLPKVLSSLNADDKAKYGQMATNILSIQQLPPAYANLSISEATQKALEPRIAEIISTEQTFNKNMRQLSTALDYLAKNDPAQAKQYEHLKKGLPEIIQSSDALLADMAKIQYAQGPDKVKLACVYLDPAKINAAQAVCADYCQDYMTAKAPLLITLKPSLSGERPPNDVSTVATGFSNFTVQPMQRVSRYEILTSEIYKTATKTDAPPEVQSRFKLLHEQSKRGSQDANNALQAGPKNAQTLGDKDAVQNVSTKPRL